MLFSLKKKYCLHISTKKDKDHEVVLEPNGDGQGLWVWEEGGRDVGVTGGLTEGRWHRQAENGRLGS